VRTSASLVIVDDDFFVTKLLSIQLKKLGYEHVKIFNDPCLAIEYLESAHQTVQLVFCDLKMPNLDGIEFIRRLGSIQFLGQLVILSAQDPRLLRSAQIIAEGFQLKVRGVLNKPVHPDNIRALMTGEPIAQSSAKDTNQAVYSPEEMIVAINRSELINFYQPKINLLNGELDSVESLIRWQHPVNGIVLPNLFLNVLQQAGLSNRLLEVVLTGTHGVLMQLSQWRAAGYSFKLAVNFSDENLMDDELPQKLSSWIRAAHLRPDDLMVEVSENRLRQHRAQALAIISRLSLKGFLISIDDFGAGETTMADLRDLPINELKFDRAFVAGSSRDKATRLALRSCLSMAHELGVTTVAEGIETFEDWVCLRDMGCNLMQGYFAARPMPASALEGWQHSWIGRLQKNEPALLPNSICTSEALG
jgi:EAL domain-containing protein (putative c-di-GMP-specific phosphodiesterase class I)